jgi:non-specific serine/threonine protein kinase
MTATSPLSPRQREVAELISRGMSTKTMARTLRVSTRTIERHVAHGAARLPELPGRPRERLLAWILTKQNGAG